MMLLLFGGQSLYSLSGAIADGRNGLIGVFGRFKSDHIDNRAEIERIKFIK
jgi:hypothetical protein